MSHDATFVVPLPTRPQVFASPAPMAAAKKAAANVQTVTVRVVPSRGQGGPAPVLQSVTVVPADVAMRGAAAALGLLALLAPHGSAAQVPPANARSY